VPESPSASSAALSASRAARSAALSLPQSVGAWSRTGALRRIDAAGIFEYMDGAGELYLAYRFDHLDIADYASPAQGEILVELYWMRTSDDAYGLLSGDWGGEPVALADAKINSFADLKGKSLVTQSKGNTAELLTLTVLKLNGMDYGSLSKANFQAAYTDAVGMMKDGHVQVFTLGTTAPASAVMDLASARDVKLVPVDDKTMGALKKENPGYNRLVIKAGTYPKQDRDVPVIGYSTHIVAACNLPEDAVYKMTKAMAANVANMSAVVKSIEGLTPKDMALDIGVPFHKGAAKFYKEAGAL